jgi:type IVB pilus formation R64 PilN family outer membrane protein
MFRIFSAHSLTAIRVFSLVGLIFLSACEQAMIIDDEVMKNEQEVQDAISTISPEGYNRSALKIDERPWFGSEAISTNNGQSLPQNLSSANAITLTFSGSETLPEVAKKIESVSGVPVVLSNNIYQSSLGTLADKIFIPSGGQEVSGGRIVWSGSLTSLLDQMANAYASDWSYNGNAIQFSSENTKTFMLNALAGELTMSGNATSTSGGGESNAPSIGIDGTTTLQIWGEISEAVTSIIGEQGQASFSPSTGTITVTARPDILRRVENYLRYQNEMRLRRIAVTVKVLSVTTNDTENYSADISGIISNALNGNFDISSSGNGTDGLSVSILKAPPSDLDSNLTTTLEASRGIERASIVHSGSLVTLSDQPAPLQIARQIAYLERVSSTSGDTSSVSLEPGTVDLGLFMTVLPRIVDGDRILMRLSISITDADPNFRTFGAGDIQIELPEIDTTGFLQNAVVSNGETLVLAGFEKSSNTMNGTKTPFGYLLGGSNNTARGRELLVLVINSRILPEQPLTIIGN